MPRPRKRKHSSTSSPTGNVAATTSPKVSDDRIVIAVDFGTTFSGVAYAFNVPGKAADVVSIMEWPGLEGFRQPKVPTLILYDERDPTNFKWGGQVDWRTPAVRGVKLLLDPDQPQPVYLPSSVKKDRKILLKDPVDVAADFIGAIYKHALSVIESASVRDYFKLCEKEFVLSVPAVWSDKAKDLTLKAAKIAGIFPVILIKEPEAAALYTLSSHDHAFRTGDTFIVCDAGGGTVDLITYEVLQIQPKLELVELVPGSGAMAGSLGLNKRFEETVRNVVGDEQFLNLKKSVGWIKALNEFDKNIKTAFTGDTSEAHFVTFPKAELEDDLDEGLISNCWEMSGKQLQEIFEPIINEILRLVGDQYRAAQLKRPVQKIKGIFLVGGFGSSQYLKKCLDEKYESLGTQVIQPHDAWGAIVKGAALSRFSSRAAVVSTQAVRNYGVEAFTAFDPILDHGRPTKIRLDGSTGVLKMTWYVRKGEDLKRDRAIKFPFHRWIDLHHQPKDLVFFTELCYSEKDVAPIYPDSSMKVVCRVRADLSSVDKKLFEPLIGINDRRLLTVKYDLVLSTAEANLKFSLEIDGKEMGSAVATYD
ncbi:hypothetical protein N0V93_008461 [Gnomoniopsis smithogilvyi]|uniref:Uncharacterized protein n=1 Tax=Gnomoniopsis smithogilvyi TaxID=1191159 RepID=A0A9W9CUS9_9PEZI|nr:hypothetical protein N0V93_008461 [Gnomoniopsis smithogilvyi]